MNTEAWDAITALETRVGKLEFLRKRDGEKIEAVAEVVEQLVGVAKTLAERSIRFEQSPEPLGMCYNNMPDEFDIGGPGKGLVSPEAYDDPHEAPDEFDCGVGIGGGM